MSLDFRALGARFRVQLSAAKVVERPYPHFILDALFSEQDLDAFYSNLPSEETFHDHGHGLQSFQIWQGAEDRRNAPRAVTRFLDELDVRLFTQEMAEVVREKFQPSLRDTYDVLFGSEANTRLGMIELEPWTHTGAVNIRAQKSTLPVHLDWPNRLVSLVLYLAPETRWHSDWGTQLHWVDRKKTPDPVGILARTAPPDSMVMTGTPPYQIAFRPGRVVAFLNTPWSHHSACMTSINSQARRWCIVKGINMTLSATERLFGLSPELR